MGIGVELPQRLDDLTSSDDSIIYILASSVAFSGLGRAFRQVAMSFPFPPGGNAAAVFQISTPVPA